MRNIIWNFFLLIYGLIQSAVVVMAYVFLSHYYDVVELIFFIVVIVVLAIIDKFLRGISGFLPIFLCIIVTPIRGIAQFIVFIASIAAHAKKKPAVSARGGYDDDYFISTFAYVAFGVNYTSRGMARKEEKYREAEEQRQEKKNLRKRILAKYPHNFDLEETMRNYHPEIHGGGIIANKMGAKITYNDDYSAMFIEYSVVIEPAATYLKYSYNHPERAYHRNLCMEARGKLERNLENAIKQIVDADRSFHGKKYYKVIVKIDSNWNNRL